MSDALRTISPVEFARRLRGLSEQADNRFAFFLGAGCSISSGIPSAGELVEQHWLPQLRDLRAPERQDIAAWTRELFPDYDPANPALIYGQVVEKLFLHPEEAQREIERLCSGPFPGFGYVGLASLMAHYAGLFNVVLTTNFDDLVQEALYLFTKARPLVVGHEALAHFIRPTRTRPLIVKLHGDQRLAPKNSDEETRKLKHDIEQQVRVLLHDRGLIFMGYGGHDASIKAMLDGLPPEALPLGVYWCSDEEPPAGMIDWLRSRNAIWGTDGGDFDTLLLLLCDAFAVELPTRKTFDDLCDRYRASCAHVREVIAQAKDDSPTTRALGEAAKSLER